jgi:hypothetical protein
VNVSHIPKFEILGCDSQPRRALQPWEPWCAATAGIQTFQKKENMCKFLDANLIQVPPPPRVSGYPWACLSISWHFWLKGLLSEAIKLCLRKRCYRWEFLSWFTSHALGCAMLLAYWDYSIEDHGPHTPFEVMPMAHLHCCPTTPGRSTLLMCGLGPYS